MRHFLSSTESTSIDKSRKPVYKVGRRVCVKRPALRRRVRGSPGSSGKISNRQKQRKGKLRGESVTGEDVWTSEQTKASILTRPTRVETKAGSSGLPVLKAWGTTAWLWPSTAKTANRAPLGFRDRHDCAEKCVLRDTWYHCRWPK